MSANLTQCETAARAQAVTVHSYHVDVDVRDASDATVLRFPVSSTIELTTTEAETWVDFIGEVVAVSIDGQPHDYCYDGARVSLAGLPQERPISLTVAGYGYYSRSGEGLHRFVDPVDGQTYLYTQYEPADARRVFPNFEQPDLRAPFTFTLTGPSQWWLGSNEHEIRRETLDGSTVRVYFATSKPMSTYVTCLCAGPYHRVSDTWQDLELGLLCRASMVNYLDAEALFDVTKRSFGWFSDNFGPYPWGKKYDQIFVPEYNLGAMENPGLVTFTEKYLFRSTPTPAQLQGRANTVAHEMSHMWFGDLVTMKWWGDLWLKESFAEFMGSHVTVEACGFDEGWVNFATQRKVGAYLADEMPTTHPIVAQIDDLEAAKTNFDRITYSKGSAALTQLVHYVGQDAFFAGARRYFAEHAYSSATLQDFIAALAVETDRDLAGWVKPWLASAGHDVLSARCQVDGHGKIVELAIDRKPGAVGDRTAQRPHKTTAAFYAVKDGHLCQSAVLEVNIEGAVTVVTEAVGMTAPNVVLLNHNDETFAKVALDADSRDILLTHVADLEPLARAVVWGAFWSDVRAGELSPDRYVAAVLAADERQSGVLAALLQRAQTCVSGYGADPVVWRDGARRQLEAAAAGSAEQLLWARTYLWSTMMAAEDVRWVLTGQVAGLEISPDLRWAALRSLSVQAALAEQELKETLALDPTAAGHVACELCLASRPQPQAKEDIWNRVHVPGGESNEMVDALFEGFNTPGQRELRAPFAESYFTGLLEAWQKHPIEIALRLVRGGFPDDGAAAARNWLDQHEQAPATLVRVLRELIFEDEIAQQVRSR